MNTLDGLDADSLREDVPNFRPGDTLRVHVRVVEGSRSRVQVFQRCVIRRQGSGLRGDVHGPQDQLQGWRGAHVPGAHADHRQDRGRDAGRRAGGRSCTTCVTCAGKRQRSRRSGRPSPADARGDVRMGDDRPGHDHAEPSGDSSGDGTIRSRIPPAPAGSRTSARIPARIRPR